MASPEAPPDLLTLITHLARARFLAGQESGKWALLSQNGTILVVRVTGTHHDTGVKASFEFRLECDGLPETAPYVYRWDDANNRRPAAMPQGASSPGVMDAFKEWTGPNNKHGGIYRAWQRYAAEHNEWRTKRPDEAWHRGRDITFILERLYDLVSEHAAWLANQKAAACV
jgi:hypothetical protein